MPEKPPGERESQSRFTAPWVNFPKTRHGVEHMFYFVVILMSMNPFNLSLNSISVNQRFSKGFFANFLAEYF